jgi:pyruvate-formate lyase
MNDLCAVETCQSHGLHEIDDATKLCLAHAIAWDNEERARLKRMTELHQKEPEAPEEDVWEAYKAEWLGSHR